VIRSDKDKSKCIAVSGNAVTLQNCSSSANREWTLTSTGMIQAKTTNRCIATNGGSTSPGARIILWSCSSSSPDHHWILTSEGMLQSKKDPTKCIAINGGAAVLGANIVLWTCSSAATDHHWTLEEANIV